MVPSNSVITIRLEGRASGVPYALASDDLAAVVRAQLASVPLTVTSIHLETEDIVNPLPGGFGPALVYGYVAIVVVTTHATYDAPADVGALVANAFTDPANAIPTSYWAEGGDTADQTAPAFRLPWAGLSAGLAWTVAVLIGLVLAVALILGWAPNVPKLATVHL